MKNKQLLQLTIIGLGSIGIICGVIVSCILKNEDAFLMPVILVAVIGFWFYQGDIWE